MLEQEITVSVALIVYNHDKYLRQAIESILMQDVNFNYEIVVGDDKSTDTSRAILLEYKEKYPEKFILILHEQNVGGTKNIYDIYMKAKGKYLAWLEGDDYWIDKKKLQKQVDFLEDNDNYLGVSHLIEARDLQDNFISRHPSSSELVGKDATMVLFLKGIYFSAAATVYRNIYLNKNEDYSILYKAHKFVGDFTLCMLLLDKGKIKVLSETMSVYRCRSAEGESNYNSIRDNLDKYCDHIQLINRINEHFKYKYDFSKKYIEESNSMLFSCLKRSGFKRFFTVFRTIPAKFKFMFYISLPFNFMKTVLLKCISCLKKR